MKKNGSAKSRKNFLRGTIATIAIVGSLLSFQGCKDRVMPDDGIKNDVPNNAGEVTVTPATAYSVMDLMERYPDQVEKFANKQLEKSLKEIKVYGDIEASYEVKGSSAGVESIVYTFTQEDKNYIITAKFDKTVKLECIANYGEIKELTDKSNESISSSKTTYETLNHVSSYEELQEKFADKIKQYLIVQQEQAFEKNNIPEDVKIRNRRVETNSKGITGVVIDYTHENMEKTLKITYENAIELDNLANYPENSNAKEKIVEEMMKASHEIVVNGPEYNMDYIRENCQQQIYDNLFPAVEDCINAFFGPLPNYVYNRDNILNYKWNLGEITEDGRVQNLVVRIAYDVFGTKKSSDIIIYNVKLKEPTLLSDLAKENFKVEYEEITYKNRIYNYADIYRYQMQYKDITKAITEKLAEKDDTFDYLNAEYKITKYEIGKATFFQICYINDTQIKEVVVSLWADDTYGYDYLMKNLMEEVEKGNFKYYVDGETEWCGNALDWVNSTQEVENTQ